MPVVGLSTSAKGTIAEHRVAIELLSRGFEVYAPLVDDHGIDFVIRWTGGDFCEVQVKAVAGKDDRWFQVKSKLSREAAAELHRWFICLEADVTAWVIPARAFFSAATVSKVSDTYTYDLNLDTTRRSDDKRRGEIFNQYRNGWELLQSNPTGPRLRARKGRSVKASES